MTLPALSLLETRVLGVLVEKQHTVPDTYPLTLNALVSGCNQKTSRDPVLEATEAEVQAAIDHMKSLSLVVESSGGRVMRYSQNVGRVLNLPPQSVALLAVLFLRGPQTAGELRINSDRLHKFGDILSVEAFLNELAERRDGALVRELAKAPGARETRWIHLLSGEAVRRHPRGRRARRRRSGERERARRDQGERRCAAVGSGAAARDRGAAVPGDRRHPIAATMRSGVRGSSRTRTPSASNNALPIAAAVGPSDASPAPFDGSSARWITSTSTAGTSEKRRIG
jgi:uncharacterized protein